MLLPKTPLSDAEIAAQIAQNPENVAAVMAFLSRKR